MLERYLDERLNTLLSDEDIADEWKEVALELEELVPVAEKMIELENQARAEELLDPKISASPIKFYGKTTSISRTGLL